jgi:hypothetical protein
MNGAAAATRTMAAQLWTAVTTTRTAAAWLWTVATVQLWTAATTTRMTAQSSGGCGAVAARAEERWQRDRGRCGGQSRRERTMATWVGEAAHGGRQTEKKEGRKI